ncbi:MAG: DUF1116 domain-containing protein [Bacilli bacterium]|jgi:hypothetical protein|nr:DUF1116 domain-containing protein [Bacilli bacterium]
MKIIKNNKEKPRVINIGLDRFYHSIADQEASVAKIDWRPKYHIDDESARLLKISTSLRKKIVEANKEAVNKIINGNPVWVDILPAGDVIEGLDDYTIIHSGPPIDYEDMVMLHQRGMVSGCLFEGWAKNKEEAIALLKSGNIKMISALDTNTVGAGTGIITKSVAMIIIEDKETGKRAATFPAEGEFQGGFCGWGLYNEGIANNLRVMREDWLPVMREAVKSLGGIPIKPILAESMQMGDENHTRQTAADLLFIKILIPAMFKLNLPKEKILSAMKYVIETPRFFHCFGQGASRTALIAADGIKHSTMVTAVCGNGVTFGIKVAGLPGKWFTAPAPMMKGKYTSPEFTIKDQLPWIGDSCVVECYGMGGLACGASPIVGNLRGLSLKQCIDITREMEKITITKNPNFPIPNLGFDFLPSGIDIVKVIETGITPEIHGGMFNYQGGLIGAGSARIPLECFKKAMEEFIKVYGE